MNYYRRYSGDYLRKTAKLSMLEHGAYSLLLDYYYADESPLPGDREEIYRMVRAMTLPDRKAIDKVLGLYFDLREDGHHNERADEEIAKAQPAIEAARVNGNRGGRPSKRKKENPTDNPTDNPDENPPGYDIENPGGLQGGIQPPSSNHQPPSTSPQPLPATPQEKAKSAAPHAEATSPETAAGTLRGAMAKALRDEGVTGVTPSHVTIAGWVTAGVALQLVREAVDLARDRKPKPEPIPLAYLVPIVEQLRNPPPPTASAWRGNGAKAHAALDWWATPDGIFAKAQTEGTPIAMRDTGDGEVRDSLVTLAHLCVKLGEGSWFDHRNQTLERIVDELRSDAAENRAA